MFQTLFLRKLPIAILKRQLSAVVMTDEFVIKHINQPQIDM